MGEGWALGQQKSPMLHEHLPRYHRTCLLVPGTAPRTKTRIESQSSKMWTVSTMEGVFRTNRLTAGNVLMRVTRTTGARSVVEPDVALPTRWFSWGVPYLAIFHKMAEIALSGRHHNPTWDHRNILISSKTPPPSKATKSTMRTIIPTGERLLIFSLMDGFTVGFPARARAANA